MQAELKTLLDLSDSHGESGKELFAACNSEIFPCDALAFAILERSLNLLRGFHLLLSNSGYTSGIGLLRMQLDSILRFRGVTNCENPHEIAASVISGTPLRKLKDRAGNRMTDSYLVSLLVPLNPAIEHIYKLSSGYIHLSDQHFYHFLSRSKLNAAGERDFCIGHDDEEISIEHKIQLVNVFSAITRGVLTIINEWSKKRHQFGTNELLLQRFPNAV
jgi:hypothetical protein